MTGLDRSAAKATNFAKIYGVGVRKMAVMIGKPLDEVQAIVSQYDAKLPFVAALSTICQEKASRVGYTVLYDGARRHWNLWEAPRIFAKGAGPCEIEEARRRIADPDHPWHGQRLSRANTYTALNALIQGTAARHTKLWMRACWREGITPLLQMHDCLDCSVRTREQAELVAQLGCDAVSLEVPMRVDLKFGRSWGDASHSWEELTGDSAASSRRPQRPSLRSSPRAPFRQARDRHSAQAGDRDPDQPRSRAGTRRRRSQPRRRSTTRRLISPTWSTARFRASRMILCPFHGETKPSMRIYKDHYYCFGCGAYGDHVDWLVQVEGLEYDRGAATSSTTGTARLFRDRARKTMPSARRAR